MHLFLARILHIYVFGNLNVDTFSLLNLKPHPSRTQTSACAQQCEGKTRSKTDHEAVKTNFLSLSDFKDIGPSNKLLRTSKRLRRQQLFLAVSDHHSVHQTSVSICMAGKNPQNAPRLAETPTESKQTRTCFSDADLDQCQLRDSFPFNFGVLSSFHSSQVAFCGSLRFVKLVVIHADSICFASFTRRCSNARSNRCFAYFTFR